MDSFLSKDYRQDCRYGENCYQKNPEHKAKFKHPDMEEKKKEEQVEENKENQENTKKRPLSTDDDDSEVDNSKKLHTMSSSEESQEETDNNTEDEAEAVKEDSKDGDEQEVFDDLLEASPECVKDDIKMKYLIEMPEDFFLFYDLCKSLNSSDPCQALKPAGLKLCGPYDTLADNIPHRAPRSKQLYLTHSR